jgi:plastocyanin
MKSMMTDDDGVMDDGVMDEDDMTNKTKVFDISGTNFSFSENEIVVHEGDTVTINFSSESGFHDWVVGEFDAATDQISAGDTTSVTFVADKSGSFEFYCSVGNHRAQGMIGTLVVEAKDMMEEGMNHSDTMMDNDDMMKGTGLENVVGATSIR